VRHLAKATENVTKLYDWQLLVGTLYFLDAVPVTEKRLSRERKATVQIWRKRSVCTCNGVAILKSKCRHRQGQNAQVCA